jgi:hypothetical protein
MMSLMEANLPAVRVDDDGVGQVEQPNDESSGLAANEMSRIDDRRGQFETTAGRADGRMIANLGFDRDDVGPDWISGRGSWKVSRIPEIYDAILMQIDCFAFEPQYRQATCFWEEDMAAIGLGLATSLSGGAGQK